MSELSQLPQKSSGDPDEFWQVAEEISRSVNAILRRARGVPAEMRQGPPLRVVRELLSAQAYVIDQLDLAEIQPSADRRSDELEQAPPAVLAPPATRTDLQPISGRSSQDTPTTGPDIGQIYSGPAPVPHGLVPERPARGPIETVADMAKGGAAGPIAGVPSTLDPTPDPTASVANERLRHALETIDGPRKLDSGGHEGASTTASVVRALPISNSQAGGRYLAQSESQSPADQSDLSQAASEFGQELPMRVARLSSTIAGHDGENPTSSLPSSYHAAGSFFAMIQIGGVTGRSNDAPSQRPRKPTRASKTASGYYDAEATTLSEPQSLQGMTNPAKKKPASRLNNSIGRGVLGATLGTVAMMVASFMFWLLASGAPRSGSAVSASLDAQERPGAAIVVAAPKAKVETASDVARSTALTNDVQPSAANIADDVGPSRLSSFVTAQLKVTGADPSTGEPQASAPEKVGVAPITSASVMEPPPKVRSTASRADLATPAISEPGASASPMPLDAQTPSAPVAKPPQKVQLTLSSADLATPATSESQTALRPSRVPKAPAKPIHQEGPAWQSDQSTSSAPQSKPVGDQASPTRQTASVAAAAGHYVPILVTLKDASTAMQIFGDLQHRHAATLSNKTGELRSFVGPDGQTWYHAIAVPAVTEAEAGAVCRSLGPEGEALDCTVATY